MKITGIVVTGVGGGVGQSVLKCLKKSRYRVIAVDSLPDATGLYAVKRGYVGEFARSDKFITRLLEICKKEKANVIFPGLDVELIPLTKHKEIFKKEDIEVIVSSEEVVAIADDKYRTAEFLKENGFLFPHTERDADADFEFPVIVKPRHGGARSENCIECRDRKALESATENNDNYIIQELVGGEEYTCGTLTLNGKCYGVIPAKRTLRCGDTYKAYFEKNDTIIKHVTKVIEKLGPYGACNVQLRLKGGKCYIFEINARCSGTTAARAIAGFNEPLWICGALEGRRLEKLDFHEIAVFRYWNELPVEMAKFAKVKRSLSTA